MNGLTSSLVNHHLKNTTMQPNKEALGMISLTAFAVTAFIVLFFTCLHILQDVVDYLVTNISAQNNLTYR
jgi:hypothetical protein